MQALSEELEIIIAVTAMIFVLTSFVAVFLIIHQRRYNRHVRERRDMQEAFEKETLKAQLEVKESTLHTISQEIHDNIGQLLSLINLNLNMLTLNDSAKSNQKLNSTRELVTKVINELRSLSKTMNSDYIKYENLGHSLQIEFDLINKLGVYNIDFQVTGTEKPMPPKKQLIIYRIAQESINNIVKHAGAKSISCQLDYSTENLDLRIRDDGVGFRVNVIDPKGKINSNGTGLRNLHHRASLIEGELLINSEIGKGTEIHLSVPIESDPGL